MNRTSTGQGGGSEYSLPRLPTAYDTGSYAAAREASQSDLSLSRCRGCELPLVNLRQCLTQAMAFESSRVPSWSWDAVEDEVGPLHGAINRYITWDSISSREPGRAVGYQSPNVLCGRLATVPVSSRRSAGSLAGSNKLTTDKQHRVEPPVIGPAAAPCIPRILSSPSMATRHQISHERREWRDRIGPSVIGSSHAATQS